MKRILSSVLILLIIICTIPIVGMADASSLFITSSKTITGKSGETIRVPVVIENIGNYDVENIIVKADVENPDAIFLTGSTLKTIDYIEGKSTEKVNFEVEIDEFAKKGSYKVNISIATAYGDVTQDSIYIRVDSKAPQLSVSRLDILPNRTIGIGENFNLGIELENQGDILAKDIKVTLEGLSEDAISLAQGSAMQTIHSIPGGFKNYAVFQLKSSKRITPGNQQLKLKLKYNEGQYEETHDIYLNVAQDSEKASNLIFENIIYPTGTVGQNQEVTLSFDLRNQGQTDAKNVIVKAISQDMAGLVPKTVSQVKVDIIAPDESQNLVFKFITTKTTETKNYPIEISIEYEDETLPYGEKHKLNQFLGVFTSGGDDNISKPKLIIDKYNFDPSLVRAGENFTMNLSFFNTNSSKTVRNIKIFLTSNERTDPNSNSGGGSVFTPVDSSNTFYIDSIPPKGRVEKKITMFTVPDAQAKTYTLTANFEYEDNQGEYTAEELIGVPVVQNSKLDTGELSVFPEAYMGQSTPVSLEFYNTGKVSLYNMMVKLEGDFQVENGQYYVGNFNSGSSEYFEGYVIPNAPGELTGAVVFTYEDSTGQVQEVRKEFTLNVMDAPPMPDFPGGEFPPFEEPQQGGIKGILKSKVFWGIFLAIIVAIVSIVVYRKKKKNKMKEMAIDE